MSYALRNTPFHVFIMKCHLSLIMTYVSFLNIVLFIFILCALMFCLHLCLCESVGHTGTKVTDSCELPCGCWHLNPHSLEVQPVLLTAEPQGMFLESRERKGHLKTTNKLKTCSFLKVRG